MISTDSMLALSLCISRASCFIGDNVDTLIDRCSDVSKFCGHHGTHHHVVEQPMFGMRSKIDVLSTAMSRL